MTTDPPNNRAAGSDANLASGDYQKPSKSCPTDTTKQAAAATALRAYVLDAGLVMIEARFG